MRAADEILETRFGGLQVLDMDYLEGSREYRVHYAPRPGQGPLPSPLENWGTVKMHELLVLEVANGTEYGMTMLRHFAEEKRRNVEKRDVRTMEATLNREVLRDEFSGDPSFEPRE